MKRYVLVADNEYTAAMIITGNKVSHFESVLSDTRQWPAIQILDMATDKKYVVKTREIGGSVPYEVVLDHFGEELPDWLIEAQDRRLANDHERGLAHIAEEQAREVE